jgi:hypothetical protein
MSNSVVKQPLPTKNEPLPEAVCSSELPETGAALAAMSALDTTRRELWDRCQACAEGDSRALGYALAIQKITAEIESLNQLMYSLQEAKTPESRKKIEDEMRACRN